MNFFNRNCFVLFILLFFVFNFSLANAKGNEKIGVLYSYKNVETYKLNDIVGFHHVWKSFIETFEATYLDYQFLCNISSDTMVENIGVNVIFFPLAIDIDQDEQIFLDNFLQSGGKLIVSSGIGPIRDSLKSFLSNHGIIVKESIVAKEMLRLKHKTADVSFELPPGNFYSDFEIKGFNRKILSVWEEKNRPAIGGIRNLVYLGYSWGQDVDKNNDIKILLKTLDYFWTSLSSKLTRTISREEYKKIVSEIGTLKKEADSVLQIGEQLDLPVPKYQIRRHFDNGIDFLNTFSSNYLLGNYMLARENANSAKSEFAISYSLGVPVRKVEVRAIWLDRGTIVGCKDATELRNLIKNLARVGFNVIFFETVNAGYPIYPSSILSQNPLVKGWDPLAVAVEVAHANGIELHAWVWSFAVGNTRHNLLLGQETNFPGPIISLKGRSWALANEDGKLRIEMQPETWISPANKKACQFLQELFVEIVKNYDVDGFQFDYIRFPFQKKYSQVGFDFVTKSAFKEWSGELPEIEGPMNRKWREWKALMVSDFVRETSHKLKEIKPKLNISAAVFGLDRTLRMQLIQQDWETWLVNGWVDAVYPFYYSFTNEEIKAKLVHERNSINDKAIIIPGFNLRVLNVGELAERITTARNSGVLGVALFAADHLGTEKKDLLVKGPFREKTTFIPYNDPYIACQKLMDDFSAIIEKLVVARKTPVLTDTQTQKEVYDLTQELKNDFQNYNSDKASDIEKKLIDLQSKVKEWLALEKYLNREQRAMYITSYLDQVKTLLNYMRDK